MTNVAKFLQKKEPYLKISWAAVQSLSCHLQLGSLLVVGPYDGFYLVQVGGGKVAGDGILYCCGCIAVGNGLLTVAAAAEQPVQGAGNVGVPAADTVNNLYIAVRVFLVILIPGSVINHGTKGVAFGTVDNPLGGGHDGDGEFFRKTLHHFPGSACL